MSHKPLPRIYKRNVSIQHEGGRIIYRHMLPKFRGAYPSTLLTFKLHSLVEKLRRTKEKGARGKE